MARKKETYRELIQQTYEHYKSMLSYYQRYYDINVLKEIKEPHYKESRYRNWKAFTSRVQKQLDSLADKANKLDYQRTIDEEQREEDYDEQQHYGSDEIESEVDDYQHVFDENQTTQLDVEAQQRTEETEQVFMSWELALYHNYMTHLYYYQFIPAVKALIDTIEGDEDIQEKIILALTGKNNRLPLPKLKQVGYYEVGMELASQVQDFLNSTTKEQLIDEAYQHDISQI